MPYPISSAATAMFSETSATSIEPTSKPSADEKKYSYLIQRFHLQDYDDNNLKQIQISNHYLQHTVDQKLLFKSSLILGSSIPMIEYV